jgi:hypothetical protein
MLSLPVLLTLSLTPVSSGGDARSARSERSIDQANAATGKYYRKAKGTKKTARRSRRGKAARAAGKRPASCGTFKYWKGGRCLDARDKKKS